MSNPEKTHYRKAFNSPYLSSADIVEPTVLTISHVVLRGDETKKTKDQFNTAYFVEKNLRQGEPLKPMILNAINSKTMKDLTGSHFIDDWQNIRVMVYVDPSVRFGRETVEGLRIDTRAPVEKKKPVITQESKDMWDRAVASYGKHGNFDLVLQHADISKEDQNLIASQFENQSE